MAQMFECYPSQVFVDDEMKPLVSGRLTVYEHDTNVLASIYSLEGSEYVAMENPVRLDEAGRLEASIFAELGVYDVKLEKYNGDGTFEDFDHFEIGIDAKLDQVGRDSVASIEALKDLDPSVSSDVVTVEAYPRRDYLWDPEAIDSEDGGVVIGSDVSPTGRWILLSDCPYIRSSVYGVRDGDITNINALFSFPRVIGSMNLVTPTTVWLEPGDYDLQTTYVSTKRIAVGPNTSWTGTIRMPCDIEVLDRISPEAPYGDMEFVNRGCTAHSSWFKRLDDFWHCGADRLVVDAANSFTDTKIYSTVNLAGKVVEGTKTWATQYVNSGCFVVTETSEIPAGFFNPETDMVKVDTYKVGDGIFTAYGTWDPGLISAGHHVQFSLAPDIGLFVNADRWAAVMYERRKRLSGDTWSEYTLDLRGRTITSMRVEADTFNTIKNGTVGNIVVAGGSLTIDHVTADILWNEAEPGFLTAVNSSYRVLANPVGLSSVTATDCSSVFLSAVDPADTALSIRGGTWNASVRLSEAHADSYVKNGLVAFRDVFITGNHNWRLNYVQLYNCTCSDKIDIYPSASQDGNFYYDATFEGNDFVGNARLWITMFYDDEHRHFELREKVFFQTMKIVNNRFDTADQHGIKMLMWHPYAGTVYMFSGSDHGVTHSLGPWEYHGNTGNCPRMNPGVVENNGHWTDSYYHEVSEQNWRVFYTDMYIWVPYTWVSDGVADSVNAAQNPTGRQFTDEGVTAFAYDAIVFPAYIGNSIQRQEYGYRCALSYPVSWDDEDANNKFIVNLYMGDGTSSLQTYSAGFTYFPSVTA